MAEHKERRKYTQEFKLEAIRLYESSGKSMRAIEQELGITPYLLAKWVQEFRQGDAKAFPCRRRRRSCSGCGARMKSCGRSARS
jgi:transposase-like protein